MSDVNHHRTRVVSGILGALLVVSLSAGEMAAQAYGGQDSGHHLDEDSPVRFLVSPHRLNRLDLDHHQVEEIQHLAHDFHDDYGHLLRDFRHLSHEDREHVKEAQHHARREIITGVLDHHQRESFIRLYRSGGSHRYGHSGLQLGGHRGDRHGLGHDGRHRGRPHRGRGHGRHDHRRHHGDRHGHHDARPHHGRRHGHGGHRGRRVGHHDRGFHAGRLFGQILGLGLHSAFGDDDHHRHRRHRGHRGRGHRGHHPDR